MPKRTAIPEKSDPLALINELGLDSAKKKSMTELLRCLHRKVIYTPVAKVASSNFQNITGWNFPVRKGRTYFIEGVVWLDVVDEDVNLMLVQSDIAASFSGHGNWQGVDVSAVPEVGYVAGGSVTDGTIAGYGIVVDAGSGFDTKKIEFSGLFTATADGLNQMKICAGNSGTGVLAGSVVSFFAIDRTTGTL